MNLAWVSEVHVLHHCGERLLADWPVSVEQARHAILVRSWIKNKDLSLSSWAKKL